MPAPAQWPQGSRIIRAHDGFTLIIVLHPHCPCSRASIRELSVLLARCPGTLHPILLLVRPAGIPQGWEQSELWRSANQLREVRAVIDDGTEARRFGAMTSGHTLLFDPAGRLRFCGGITVSRGHEGDNAGVDAIVSTVAGTAALTASTPVFGCPLFSKDSTCARDGAMCLP